MLLWTILREILNCRQHHISTLMTSSHLIYSNLWMSVLLLTTGCGKCNFSTSCWHQRDALPLLLRGDALDNCSWMLTMLTWENMENASTNAYAWLSLSCIMSTSLARSWYASGIPAHPSAHSSGFWCPNTDFRTHLCCLWSVCHCTNYLPTAA